MNRRQIVGWMLLVVVAALLAQCGKDGQTTHYVYITRAEWSPVQANSILIAKEELDVTEGGSSGCNSDVAVPTTPPSVPAYGLYLTDTAGVVQKQLSAPNGTSDQVRFKWAQQGNKVLVWDNGNSPLRVIDTAGSAVRCDSAVYISDADWSPGGSAIICSAIKVVGNVPKLYRVDLPAGTMTPLYTTGQTGAVSWSSKNVVAFVIFDSAAARLAAIDFNLPTGSGIHLIDTAVAFYNLDFSPDGNTLLYSRKTSTSNDIVFHDFLTDQHRTFLQFLDGTQILGLRFSPDGTMLSYYAYQTSGQFDLYAINTDGSAARSVATLSSDGSWSPDSRSMAYVYYNKLSTKQVR